MSKVLLTDKAISTHCHAKGVLTSGGLVTHIVSRVSGVPGLNSVANASKGEGLKVQAEGAHSWDKTIVKKGSNKDSYFSLTYSRHTCRWCT